MNECRSLARVLALALALATAILPGAAAADWLAPRVTLADVVGVAANDTLAMRAEPSPRAPVVDRLPPYAGVDVERCQREPKAPGPNWCRVFWNGGVGWVNARYLTIHDGVHTYAE